jgi:hypothetical protein
MSRWNTELERLLTSNPESGYTWNARLPDTGVFSLEGTLYIVSYEPF